MRIAFFDSGMGGLTVLHAAVEQQPQHQYVYFADTLNAPYGGKPAAEVRDLTSRACDFIATQAPDALVVACNTATAVCIEVLRQRYPFPVIGMEPAVKLALAQTEAQRVLVMATSLTLQESKLSQLLQRFDTRRRTDKLAMDRLVSFAEQQQFDTDAVRAYVQAQLQHYDCSQYAAVVLGCTHFAYFTPLLRTCFPADVQFVDGSQGTVRHLFDTLKSQPQPPDKAVDIIYFVSKQSAESRAFTPYFERLASIDKAYSSTYESE